MQVSKGWRFRCAVVAVCAVVAMLAGCSRDPNVRKQKYLESGERYYDKGQYREAAIQFQNAIQVDQNFAEAHFRLGQTAAKLQQWPAAAQEFERAIAGNPEHAGAHLAMANLFLDHSTQFADAKVQIDWLLQNQPNNADVYLALAKYDDATKDISGALTALGEALKRDPNRSEFHMARGIIYAEGQQWDKAQEDLKLAVALDPKSVEANLKLGNFYQSRGQFPEADEYYRKAIQAAPGDPNPRMAMGNLLLSEGKPQEVENFLRDAKKDFANNSVGYCMLGNYYIATNQIDKALTEFGSLHQEHPKDPILKKNYTQLLIMRDRLDDARKLNDEVLKAQPGDEDAEVYKGEIELRSGKANTAVDTLQNVLKNDPDNAVAHFQLGMAFDQMGNADRAEAEWRNAVRLRPDLLEVHGALAKSAVRRNDASALAVEGDQLIALQPRAAQGYLWRGMAEAMRKQYPAADRYLSQAVERDPDNSEAYVELGNLRVIEKQPDQAQKDYQKALDLDPGSVRALGGLVGVDGLQNQPDRAIARVKAQLVKYPNNSEFHVLLGDLLQFDKKDNEGAQAEYKQAATINKNNVDAVTKLALLQIDRGASDTALQTFLEGIRNNPGEITFYRGAGQIYQGEKNWDQAKQMYQKALAIQPDDAMSSNNLAFVMLQEGGNLDVAFSMAQTARRQLPDSPASADTLGWAFYQRHVYSSAIGLFEEARKKEPENLTYNYHLGLAYAKNGQPAQARQQLERVVKIKPNSTEAEDLRREG